MKTKSSDLIQLSPSYLEAAELALNVSNKYAPDIFYLLDTDQKSSSI